MKTKILILIVLIVGAWFAGNEHGASKTIIQANKKVAAVQELYRLKELALNKQHQIEVNKFVKEKEIELVKTEGLKHELKLLSKEKTCTDDEYLSDVVGLLQRAINTSTLPTSKDRPFAITGWNSIAEHHLHCITEYNKVVMQLNKLIKINSESAIQ